MDRETTFLLALGMLIVAGIVVSAGGWVVFVRDRRSARDPEHTELPGEVTPTDPRSEDA